MNAVEAPEAPQLYYDIGNVLYRQGDYEGAAEAFTRDKEARAASFDDDADDDAGDGAAAVFGCCVGAIRGTRNDGRSRACDDQVAQ